MIRNFISLISLCLLVMFAGANCAGSSDSPIPPSEKSPYYVVLADEHLQQPHKVAILKALNDWQTKTNYTLTYKLDFVDMSQYPKDQMIDHTIRIYVSDPGPGYLGWTDWNDKESAYVLVEPGVNGELFRRIMLHELGHAFSLSFDKGDTHYEGPYESVMHPGLYDDALEVSCPELTSFCNLYGCQVDCNNVLIPVPQPANTSSYKIPTEIAVPFK